MKIKLIKTYTGNWLEVGDFKVSDFEIEQTAVKYGYDRKSAIAEIVLILKDSIKEKLKNVLGDPEARQSALAEMLNGTDIWMRREETFRAMIIHVSNEAKLKNVRKKETRKIREQEAWDKVEKRLKKYSQKWIDERIVSLNELVQVNVKQGNEGTLDHAKRTLSWFDSWVEEADKKAKNEALKEDIEGLKERLKVKRQELRESRNKAFLAIFEKEKWEGPDPDNAPLPKEIVDLWKGMLKRNEAFVGGGRLIF